MNHEFHCADCLDWMRDQPAGCVDHVFTSPPYEAARTYGIDFDLRGQEYVDWCVERFHECLRVCNGLVAWVIDGPTRKYRWSAVPVLLMAELHRHGVHLRKPPIFQRSGIPGSGGPDWLRNNYEFIVCATNGGRLPWSDNLAMGQPPKYNPGGAMSYRLVDGSRRNKKDAEVTGDSTNGAVKSVGYVPPKLANPGNVIRCSVGGGRMGSEFAHENEAPFPESLAEFFIRSFCRPGGTVLDPFSGSGTTVAVAAKLGRRGIGVDIRENQVALGRRRLAELQPQLIA
jgi:DNA methylase